MRIKTLFTLLLFPLSLLAEEKFSYIPQIHGTFRGRYELETENMENRFQIRNARLSVNGFVAPIIDYYIQFDACDRGKMRFLDAWGRLSFTKEFNVQVGQFRKPCGLDAFRSPANQYFANRSFIAKQVGNIRGVGGKITYKPRFAPLTIEAGVFNKGTTDNQEAYAKSMSYAARIIFAKNGFTVLGGWQTIVYDIVRVGLVDAALQYEYDRWHLEAEYMYKHYRHEESPDCHAYNAFVEYKMPVKMGVFNKTSFLARFDGMTDHSDGISGDDLELDITDVARNRITVGGTLSYVYKKVHADIRLNYEKYLYHSDYTPTQGNRDKIVAELVVRF